MVVNHRSVDDHDRSVFFFLKTVFFNKSGDMCLDVCTDMRVVDVLRVVETLALACGKTCGWAGHAQRNE